MNAVTQFQAATPPSNGLVPQNMDQAVRLAEIMARSKLVPAHLQGSVGDCFMVVEQAGRWNMSPFAVGQCTSSIKGKLMYEGKLVQAAVENSGAIVGLMDYAYRGAGQDRTITVSATRRGEAEPRTVDVVLKDAITDNNIWKRQPDQQLAYHGARVWARRWTPGVILGVYSPEEMDPPVHREPEHPGPTLDAVAETVQLASEPPAPARQAQAEPARSDAMGTVDALREGAPLPEPEDAPPHIVEWVNKQCVALRTITVERFNAWLANERTTNDRAGLRENYPALSAQLEAGVATARQRLHADADELETGVFGGTVT